MTTSSTQNPSAPRIGTVVIACLATCLAVASVYLTQPIFADIAKEFDLPVGDARLAFGVASIAYALAFFFLGPLSDYVSPNKMARVGLTLTALCLAAATVVPQFDLLLVAMAASGAAAAMVPAAMFALLPRIAQREQVGTYFGLIIAASVVGITLGRAGMGMLAGSAGWQHAFLIAAGALLLTAAVTLLLPHEGTGHAHKPPSIGAAYRNGLSMLVEPRLLLLFATGFLLFFGYLGVVTFLTFRLKQAPFSYNSAAIGSISLVGLSAVLGAPLSGKLATKVGPRVVALAGLGIVALAIACLRVAETDTMATVGLFTLFLGVFSCQPAIFMQIAGRAGSDRRGASSSLYLLTCLGAGSLASFLLGPVWAAWGWPGITGTGLAAVAAGAAILLGDGYVARNHVAIAA